MNLYEQALVVYNDYVQRIRSEAEQRVRQEEAVRLQHLLIHLLTLRFGAVPEDVLARIRDADTAQLGHWAELGLTAQSLDDVFA
jgi:hypothetical protein